ncbi:DUF2953 domain-containing protein [Ruminococcus sp. Marseille-P6503]|uniref:DUF2953 domain-containing protein n=1 Tax=Ruminococcus sp. Marseille-P6503 TaxID=2364796 RepID=UPI000F51F804|nr:DUF2953 domain-containing protein [Ruminococcus sp. Marseille-P6503]
MIAIIVLWILLTLIAVIVILLHFSVTAYIKADSDGFDIKIKYMLFTVYPRAEKKANKKSRTKKIKSEKKSKDLFEDNIDDDFADTDINEGTERIDFTESNKTDNSGLSEDVNKLDAESYPDDNFDLEELEKSFEAGNYEDAQHKEKPKGKKKRGFDKKADKKRKKSGEGFFAGLKEKYGLVKPYIPMGWKYFKKLCKTIRFTDIRISLTVGREDAHEAAVFYGAIQGVLFNFLGTFANIFTVKIKKANVNCVFTRNTISGEAEAAIRIRPSAVIALAVCIAVNFLIIFIRQRRENKKDKKSDADAGCEQKAAAGV